MSAQPSARGRTYREHGRIVTDVELFHPDTGATVIVEIPEHGTAQIHDSRLGYAEPCPDPEETIAILKSRGYVEYNGSES